MLLPGRGDSEEPTGETTAVPVMTGNDRKAERASNDEPDGTTQATRHARVTNAGLAGRR